jgi:glucan phosphoethanolaminetransferase (alkaline phosphatase superfamily)
MRDPKESVPKRVQVLKATSLALFASLLLSPLLICSAPPAEEPPNVILITIDTVRADHLGCYGYKLIETPNLDALAASGVRFRMPLPRFPSPSPRTV